MAWVGEIPEGQVVRHRCDNPPCINPAHLELGTHADNSADAVDRRRTATWNRRPHKLTDAEVEHIRARYMSGGISQRALAEDYDICQQLVSHLVRRTRRTRPSHPPLS
ncbi:HNH endonuclease [Gordonia amicalis]